MVESSAKFVLKENIAYMQILFLQKMAHLKIVLSENILIQLINYYVTVALLDIIKLKKDKPAVSFVKEGINVTQKVNLVQQNVI